jgi:hypothetical protein
VDIMIENIMLKECVIIVIINLVGLKNHGNVLIKNYMQMDYVKIVISTVITKQKEKKIISII